MARSEHRWEADRGRAELEAALGLWRGPALADVADELFAQVEASRLEELRLTALEERIDAQLALGEHTAWSPSSIPWFDGIPCASALRSQLMLALYRSGRQAEALRVYANARRTLVDELGLEPGPDLQRLEQAILRQDSSLSAPRRTRLGRRGRIAALLAVPLGVAVAVLAGVVILAGGKGAPRADSARSLNAVAFVSTRTGRLLDRTDELNAPLQSRFFGGAFWNLSATGILSKIDPQTGNVIGSANTAAVPCGLAAGEGALWISDCSSPTVVRIDPAHDIVVGRTTLPVPRTEVADATQSVVIGAGSVWVGQGFDNPSFVWRLDPESGRVQHRYVIPAGGAEALAFGDGALWVGGGVIGHLSRIDPVTNAVTSPARDLGEWLCCVAAAAAMYGRRSTPRHGLEVGREWRRCEQHQARLECQGARLRGRSRLGGRRGQPCPHRSGHRHDAAVRARPCRDGQRAAWRRARCQRAAGRQGRDR